MRQDTNSCRVQQFRVKGLAQKPLLKSSSLAVQGFRLPVTSAEPYSLPQRFFHPNLSAHMLIFFFFLILLLPWLQSARIHTVAKVPQQIKLMYLTRCLHLVIIVTCFNLINVLKHKTLYSINV